MPMPKAMRSIVSISLSDVLIGSFCGNRAFMNA